MPNLSPDEIALLKRTAEEDLDYRTRPFDQEYRSTAHLVEFLRSIPGLEGGEAIDVGCGAGANIFHLARKVPSYRWTGLDIAGSVLFPLGRPWFAATGLDVTLVDGDFFRLKEIFAGQRFELVLSIQSLLVIPTYEKALDQLLALTKGWLVVTGLFIDFQVDARIEVLDYTWSADCQGPFHFSVYSLARFRKACEEHGCRDFVSHDFEIDIDLPRPANGGLRTYTGRLASGSRLQFTGPTLEPWKFVAMRVPGSLMRRR